MIDIFFIAQIVGIIGVGFVIATWQFNKRTHILRVELLSGLVWAIHFCLLGAYTGASINLIGAVRNYLFEKYRRKWSVFWLVIIVSLIAVVVTWKNWTSLLPATAILLGTYAMWQESPKRMRFLSLTVPPFWIVYNLLNGSYPGMIADVLAMCAVMLGIYRFDVLPIYRLRMRKKLVKV